jgi:hypothetical protein
MAIEPFSPCPGGLDKKVKFCCPDLVKDLDKIDRMLEAGQRQACLEYLEKLDARHPGRACLTTTKAELLREMGRTEEADTTVRSLLGQQADNPVALAEAVLLACDDQGAQAAIPRMQQALAAARWPLPERVLHALSRLVDQLYAEGEIPACHAHLVLYLTANPQDRRALQLLVALGRTRAAVLQKEELSLPTVPDDAPWKADFEASFAGVGLGAWAKAADGIAAVAERWPQSPELWLALAALRLRLLDHAGACDALRRRAALPIPLDDAVEAEALAQLVDEDRERTDVVEFVSVDYTTGDLDAVQQKLDDSPQTVRLELPPMSLEGDNAPPRAGYLLLDRPQLEPGAEAAFDRLPRTIGQCFLFGRQTDREPRVNLLAVRPVHLDAAKETLRGIAGDLSESGGEPEIFEIRDLDSELLNVGWQPPPDMTYDARFELLEQHRREVLLDRWPKLPMRRFGGLTAEQAAADPARRIAVLAAILVLEDRLQQQLADFDFNQLRTRLGLPLPEPIDPTQVDLQRLPLIRLHRVMVDRLSTEGLEQLTGQAVTNMVVAAIKTLMPAAIERGIFKDSLRRAQLFGMLANLQENARRAFEYIDLAREADVAERQSSAPWDLQELEIRARCGDVEDLVRLHNHIVEEHLKEPGVAQLLMQHLVELGVLHPDGTPVEARERSPQIVGAGAAAEAGKIWTPESERGDRGKLWVPGD